MKKLSIICTGLFFITLIACETENQILEENELEIPVILEGQAKIAAGDLQITNTRIFNPDPRANGIVVVAHVTNRGFASISQSSRVKFYSSWNTILDSNDQFLGSQFLKPLSINEEGQSGIFISNNIYRNLIGSYIICIADGDNQIQESNEQNNNAVIRATPVN